MPGEAGALPLLSALSLRPQGSLCVAPSEWEPTANSVTQEHRREAAPGLLLSHMYSTNSIVRWLYSQVAL